MKRVIWLRLINIVLTIVYLAVFSLQYFFKIIELDIIKLWFPLLIFLVSISMLLKAVLYKSDSSFWLFTNLILISLVLFIYYSIGFNPDVYWPVFILIVGFSCLMTGLLFKEVYQIRISLYLITIFTSILLFSLNIINLLLLIVFIISAILLSLIISYILPQRWYKKK